MDYESRKVSASSRVNFLKMSDEEKLERFRNMAKSIKLLKAKNRAIKRKYYKLYSKKMLNGGPYVGRKVFKMSESEIKSNSL